jgi:hypothetical protein
MKGGWPRDDDRNQGSRRLIDINGAGNRRLAGAHALAIVLFGRGLIVVVPGFLDRPRRFLGTRMRRIYRPAGKGRRREQQHQRCQAGPESAESHSVNLVT